MNLDDAQKQKVAAWLAEGLKLSEIQNRLMSELGLRLSYMEVRLLIADLNLKPKDIEPPKSAVPVGSTAPAGQPGPGSESKAPLIGAKPDDGDEPVPGNAGVSVSVDKVTRPGSLVSGKVTFSDGKAADWYLDQFGRLGLAPKEQGYRPSQNDVMAFQAELQNEMAKLGL